MTPRTICDMSAIEDTFAWWLRREEGVPRPVREYRFDQDRKWRFDFAWPSAMVAVEIEGVTHAGGRHQRVAGFIADAEKYEAAMLQGWRVYRVPGQWVQKGRRLILRPEVMRTIRRMVGRTLALAGDESHEGGRKENQCSSGMRR